MVLCHQNSFTYHTFNVSIFHFRTISSSSFSFSFSFRISVLDSGTGTVRCFQRGPGRDLPQDSTLVCDLAIAGIIAGIPRGIPEACPSRLEYHIRSRARTSLRRFGGGIPAGGIPAGDILTSVYLHSDDSTEGHLTLGCGLISTAGIYQVRIVNGSAGRTVVGESKPIVARWPRLAMAINAGDRAIPDIITVGQSGDDAITCRPKNASEYFVLRLTFQGSVLHQYLEYVVHEERSRDLRSLRTVAIPCGSVARSGWYRGSLRSSASDVIISSTEPIRVSDIVSMTTDVSTVFPCPPMGVAIHFRSPACQRSPGFVNRIRLYRQISDDSGSYMSNMEYISEMILPALVNQSRDIESRDRQPRDALSRDSGSRDRISRDYISRDNRSRDNKSRDNRSRDNRSRDSSRQRRSRSDDAAHGSATFECGTFDPADRGYCFKYVVSGSSGGSSTDVGTGGGSSTDTSSGSSTSVGEIWEQAELCLPARTRPGELKHVSLYINYKYRLTWLK